MISVLVLTHGQLAHELLDAARKIDPLLGEDAVALALPWDLDSDEACQLLNGWRAQSFIHLREAQTQARSLASAISTIFLPAKNLCFLLRANRSSSNTTTNNTGLR